jgi:peroxisomal 3,2-trans-enoyl-CoA isomerase
VSKQFEEARGRLSTFTEDPGNDVKLKLYALFKQATVGTCNTPKPSMVDFVNRAKWNAWSDLKSLSQVNNYFRKKTTSDGKFIEK